MSGYLLAGGDTSCYAWELRQARTTAHRFFELFCAFMWTIVINWSTGLTTCGYMYLSILKNLFLQIGFQSTPLCRRDEI